MTRMEQNEVELARVYRTYTFGCNKEKVGTCT